MPTPRLFSRRALSDLRSSWILSVLLIAGLMVAMLPGMALAAAAPVESAAAVASSYSTHTVTYGDTLNKIAARYGTTVQALMAANGISNPNRIYVGQVLYIPTTGGQSGSCAAYHVVKPGETLYRIAGWYSADAYAIAQANNMTNLNHIYVGQSLCIPGGWTPPPPPPAHNGFWYTVKAGDTLNKIAARYGTTIHALMAANNLSNPNRILIGQALWIPGSTGPAPQPKPTPPPSTPPANTGAWTGLYYANKDLSGSPALVRQDSDVKFNWGEGSPGAGIPVDGFSVLWTRTFNYSGGTYRFFATSDDGVRVYVDGALLINGWKEQPATGYFQDIYLSPGVHTLRVEYFEATQMASIYVYWAKQ